MMVNVTWAKGLTHVLDAVNKSNCIYANRWGDLPLWGATKHLAGGELEVLQLAYHHGSHGVQVLPGVDSLSRFTRAKETCKGSCVALPGSKLAGTHKVNNSFIVPCRMSCEWRRFGLRMGVFANNTAGTEGLALSGSYTREGRMYLRPCDN